MDKQIFWVLELAIKPDMYNKFDALRDEMIQDVTSNEAGVIAYEWFMSDDKSTCHIYERYKDSAAVMEHLDRFFTAYVERFFAAADSTRMIVYGNVSDQVRETLGQAGAQFISPWP